MERYEQIFSLKLFSPFRLEDSGASRNLNLLCKKKITKLNFEYPIIPPFNFIKIQSTQKALVHLIQFLVKFNQNPVSLTRNTSGEDRRPRSEQ